MRKRHRKRWSAWAWAIASSTCLRSFPAASSSAWQWRARINHPKLILADEPTGNLDEANEEIVLSLLRELHSEGHTILMVTHAATIGRLADRRIEFAHGHLVQATASLKPELA